MSRTWTGPMFPVPKICSSSPASCIAKVLTPGSDIDSASRNWGFAAAIRRRVLSTARSYGPAGEPGRHKFFFEVSFFGWVDVPVQGVITSSGPGPPRCRPPPAGTHRPRSQCRAPRRTPCASMCYPPDGGVMTHPVPVAAYELRIGDVVLPRGRAATAYRERPARVSPCQRRAAGTAAANWSICRSPPRRRRQRNWPTPRGPPSSVRRSLEVGAGRGGAARYRLRDPAVVHPTRASAYTRPGRAPDLPAGRHTPDAYGMF